MGTRTKGRLSLLLLSFAVVMLIFPAMAIAQDAGDPTGTSAPAPTIQSDKADYPPADTVILTGSNWQPGETVNINVNDDEGQTWNRNVDEVADENGDVRDEFVLPDWFVATYSVKATGASGAIATTTFTDAALPSRGCPDSNPLQNNEPILVTTTADQFDAPATSSTPPNCSLREAINAANSDPNTADTIILPPGDYTLTRTGSGEDNNATGDLDITRELTINGSGARTTNIQAGTNNTNGIDRVLHVSSSGILTLSGATVRYGQINDDGGGIKTDRPLTLNDVAITENDATTGKSGGGISHQGNLLTLNRVTISGNTAALDGGGLHSTSGNANLTNVTITNNSATGSNSNGGGVRATSDTKTLVNVTVSHNSARNGSNISQSGGTVSLHNTIVSNNLGAGTNCSGTIGNTANNLDSGASCGFGSANSSKSNANANLGALANNLGPTDTRALGAGSAAIDTGTATGAPNHDQRNLPRPRDGDGNGSALHDIGAYELQAPINVAPATTVPTFDPASPKTNDNLQASTTTSDADNNNVSVAWVWKVTRDANTCQVKTDTSAAAAPGARTSSLDLSQSYTTSNCTGASPPASINPSKGDTVVVEATPNDGSVNGTMQSNSVAIANSAPTCATVSLTTDEDTTGSASPDCTDADGDTLTYSIVDQGSKGTASVNDDGELVYEPNENANGEDSFTYKASDGSADSNTATVNVTINAVNDDPTISDIADQQTNEDTSTGAISFTVGDVETAAGSLEVEGSSSNTTLVPNDNIVFGGTGANRTVTITPAADEFGTATITVTVTDADGGTASDTFTLTVNPVNDAPILDLNGGEDGANYEAEFTEDEGAVSIVGTSGADALSVADVDDTNMESATAELTNPQDGAAESLSVDTAGTTVNVTAYNPTTGVLSLSGSHSKAEYEQVLRTVKYNNTDQDPSTANDRIVEFVVNDGEADSGKPESTVAVIAVNDAPVAEDDSYSVAEDGTLNVAPPGVLGNDTDVDSANLTAVKVSDPANGNVTFNADGSFSYSPQANFNGSDSFTYKANDGTADSNVATVNITVNAVNDAPIADNGTEEMNEDGAPIQIDFGALVQDVETSEANLTYNITAPPAAQGSLSGTGSTRTFDSADNFNGTVTINYTVTDRGDPDNCGAPSSSCDAPETSAQKTVTVTVNPVNDAPSFTKGDDQTVDEDSGLQTVPGWATNISAGPANESGQTVSFLVSNDNNNLFTDQGQPAIDSSGTLTYRSAPDAFGSATVTVRAQDNGGVENGGQDTSAEQTFTITVSPVNDNPVITSVSNDGPVDEGSPATIAVNATDVDNTSGQLRYRFDCDNDGNYDAAAQPANTYQCTFNDEGIYRVNVEVTDGAGGSATSFTNVQVNNANPSIGPLNFNGTNSGTACISGNNVSLSFSITDPGSADSISGAISWGDGTITQFTGRSVSASHTYVAAGSYTVNVVANDGDGGTDNTATDNSGGSVSLLYNVSNLLEPVNPVGTTMSVFKYGSTVPLKVRITDCNNQPVNGLVPRISFTKVNPSTPAIGVNEGLSTQPNDTNFLMRDAGNGYYIYNLNTKSLADGDASYKATITDSKATQTAPAAYGPKVSQNFGLRSK